MAITDRALGLTGGIAVKAPVLVASTANLTLESSQTIDVILVSTGDRVLVWVQNSTSQNGVYVVDGSTWARSKDFDGKNDVARGTLIYISTGTAYGGKFFTVTSTGDNVPGTNNITFANSGSLTVPSTITVSAVNSTGGLAVSLSTANIFTHTLSTATVLLTPTNGVAGQWFTVSFLQGSSTNYALTYSSDYRFGGGSTGSTAPAINTTVLSRAALTCFMPSTGYVQATLTNYGI